MLPKRESSRFDLLDPVRFFAAFSVVVYHYFARWELENPEIIEGVAKFGYLGVPVFFIVSGFVIAISAENRSAMTFAFHRFMRLYPTYWLAIIFVLLVGAFFSRGVPSFEKVLANATMLNDYLGYKDLDGVFWTLKAELKFYTCIGLLILFRIFHHYYWWLSIWSIFSVVHLLTGEPYWMGWFITPKYSPFFIAGICFYLISKEGLHARLLALLLVAFVSALVRSYQEAHVFFYSPTLIDQFVVAAILTFFFLLFYKMTTKNVEFEKTKITRGLGDLTYPLYLIHNVSGILIIDYLALYIPYELSATFVLALMIFISWLILVGYERPLVNPLKRKLASLVWKR